MAKEEGEIKKARSFQLKKMLEITDKKAHSLILECSNNNNVDPDGNENRKHRSQGARPSPVDSIGSVFNRASDQGPVSRLSKEGRGGGGGGGNGQSKEKQGPSDMEQMKERFAKLLLGEDMSGGGKGVSSALALSNAITNLAASVFGEQRKLEPMAPDRKARWKKEVDWLLSVTDHIVEFVPSQQKSKDGTNMDIMVTQQRRDLLMNIPALRKLDAMLIGCLDNFGNQNEFWYVSRDSNEAEQREDKWWLPKVKVPPEGLSEASRKWLQFQKECVNQVLKASMAINSQILCEMEVPENYIESLPKNGRSSLGESIYKGITVESFNPEEFLQNMDLSTEHKVVDLKNRIEASIVIWKRKMNQKDGKSSWSSAVSLEKRELFEERAETILILLKQRFPGISQSTLDISKIQYNKDVGHAILESYSRVLESLANTVMSRIEDILYADARSRDASLPSPIGKISVDPTSIPTEDGQNPNAAEAPTSLADFMGWSEQAEADMKKMNSMPAYSKEENEKFSKSSYSSSHKRFSYIEKLEILNSLKSPARI